MESNVPERVPCPLVDEMIDDIDCMENSDVARGLIKPDTMPEIYKQKENWREICRRCEWYDY